MSNTGERATPPDPPETTLRHPLQLVFIRHGSSTWNDEGRIQGQLDPPLSEKGREQAEKLAARLRDETVDALYSSDLQRARSTADAVSGAIGKEVALLPELREVALGEWEGLNRHEIIERYPAEWKLWRTLPSWDRVP